MDTFKVEVIRTPEPNRPGINFDVKVMRYLAGSPRRRPAVVASTQAYLIGSGNSILLGGGGQLPQVLNVTWAEGQPGACTDMLDFRYGTGDLRTSFAWKMDTLGWSVQPSDLLPINQVPKFDANEQRVRSTQTKRACNEVGNKRMPDYIEPGAYCTVDFLDGDLRGSNKVACYFSAQGNA